MGIDGRTKLVGLLGGMIDFSPSPAMHNAAFEKLGLDWRYLPLPVSSARLSDAIKGLQAMGFRGANVTVPHKVAAAAMADRLQGEAQLLGCVNTLVFEDEGILGYNTDVRGLLRSLREEGVVNADSLFLIGAGGAARAAALALRKLGAETLHIFNRSRERAEGLAELAASKFSYSRVHVHEYGLMGSEGLEECSVVINSTPLAQDDRDELKINYNLFSSGQVVVDLNYIRSRSSFLREAERRGAQVINGRLMLLYQAAESFKLWTGKEAPVREMKCAMEEKLIREAVERGLAGGRDAETQTG